MTTELKRWEVVNRKGETRKDWDGNPCGIGEHQLQALANYFYSNVSGHAYKRALRYMERICLYRAVEKTYREVEEGKK